MKEEASNSNPVHLCWFPMTGNVTQDKKRSPHLSMLQASNSLPASDQNSHVTYFVNILPGIC